MVFLNRYEQTLERRSPTAVASPPPAPPPPSAPRVTATQRLEELDSLRSRDMISEDEYQRKRTQILNEL